VSYGIKRVIAALKVASVLSQIYAGRPVTVKQISAICGLSESYLEQIFCEFRKAKIVTSVRGPGGGYHLELPELTVADVVRAVTHAGTNVIFQPVLDALQSVPVSKMLHEDAGQSS
jgi:Rrf2 family transcriptional regulator, iron-sulfur cluster assembly transcription factor